MENGSGRDIAALEGLATPPGIRIRAYREEDFGQVRGIAVSAGWASYRDRPEVLLPAWRGSWPALVAVDGDQIVGFLRAITDGHMSLYVADVAVRESYRGRGIGSVLLYACHLLYPSTRVDLLAVEEAVGFYPRLGFQSFQGYRKRAADFETE